MTAKIVHVFYENLPVGTLSEAENKLIAFEYNSDFIKNGFSVSPFFLPLRQEVFIGKRQPFEGLHGVFNDSLPDGWGRLLIDRMLIKHRQNLSGITPLDRLCIAGNSTVGALQYKPQFQLPIQEEVIQDLDYISLEAQKILSDRDDYNLDLLVKMAGSSGGARPKVFIDINGEEWLIKFRSSTDQKNMGVIEYQHSLMAKKAGIDMPETKLFPSKVCPGYFGVKRFDRENNKKIHVHSASGLLYASYRYPSVDYIDLLKATYLLTRSYDEVSKLFRIMVFNILIQNKDDHTKNFSFLYKDDKWQLSPAYDLVPSDGMNGEHATTVAGVGKDITENDMLNVAKDVGFNLKKAKRIIDDVKSLQFSF